MALIFHPPREVIELVLKELKADKQVHPDAVFNASAPNGLRKEVTYRDLDFIYRLGRTSLEEKIVDAALEFLKSQGLVTRDAGYDKAAFESLHRVVKQEFKGSWTSLSPTDGEADLHAHERPQTEAPRGVWELLGIYLGLVRRALHRSESVLRGRQDLRYRHRRRDD